MKIRIILLIICFFPVISHSQNIYNTSDSLFNVMLHPDGSGWGDEDKTDIGNKKKVLLIGDSMLSGYGDIVKSSLKDVAVVDEV